MRIVAVCLAALTLMGCARFFGEPREGFPDVTEVPEQREPTLTGARRDQVAEELEEARDAARERAEQPQE